MKVRSSDGNAGERNRKGAEDMLWLKMIDINLYKRQVLGNFIIHSHPHIVWG